MIGTSAWEDDTKGRNTHHGCPTGTRPHAGQSLNASKLGDKADTEKMQRTIDSLRLELRGRKTEAEYAELKREKEILEDLVVSTQG